MDIPTSLADITLRQYKVFFKFQEKNTNVRLLQAQMISIFCNVPIEDVLQMKYQDTQEVIKILDELFIEKPKLVQRFKLNGIQYGFHPSLDDLTLGEYVDLDTYVGDWNNIEKAMNVLYRPIEAKFGESYAIGKYKLEHADNIIDMPMSAVTSSLFFLLTLGIDLSKTMMKSLDKGQKEALTEYLNLEQNGGGITQFMNSLKGMLQELNISSN